MRRVFYIFFLLVVSLRGLEAQESQKYKLIQASGVITNRENEPVYNASVFSQKLRRGTISEVTGIYSIVSMPGDTIIISALGYKKHSYSIPSDFDGRIYKQDVMLVADTISIEGITIFPWKTYEEFKREFLATRPVIKPEIQYMYENLYLIQESINQTGAYAVTPEAGFRMAMQQNANAIMTRNQNPANNLLNPFAWAKFFSGLKSGLLKNEKSEEKSGSKTKARRQK